MGEKSLRGRVVVLLVLVALAFQASFIVTGGDSDQGELYGGLLRVALKGEVTNLNPLTAVNDTDWQVIDIIYDSLARFKTDTENNVLPEPWLAESWTVIDNDTVNVRLRTGLKWHDMTDVTADDVVYTFSNAQGMKRSLKYGQILTNLSAIKIDAYNVQFDLSNYENRGWFFTRVLTIPLIQKDFDVDDDENGCGPYRFKSFNNQIGSATDEVIILRAKGDETRASMKHRFVSSDALIKRNNSDWSGNYVLHEASGSITIPTPPVPNSTVNATYSYNDRSLTIEAFDDYFYKNVPFNKGPYLDEIKFTFNPDNPGTEYFDEGTDRAIIDLILGNIDAIGFGLSSVEVNADRYLDVATGDKTKLSDETWKIVASFKHWDYLTAPDPSEATEAAADDFLRDNPDRTLRKSRVYIVNVSGDPTVVKEFENRNAAEKYVNDTPGLDLKITETWYIREFFLALDDNPGFKVLYLGMNTQRTPLNDINFRLAIANLTDRNLHYDYLGMDKKIGHSPVIPQNAYWYNESIPIYKLEHYPLDNEPILAPVNLQLDKAGYKDMKTPIGNGSDGFRDLPNRTMFSLTLKAPKIKIGPSESPIGASIQERLSQVGINTTIEYDTWKGIRDNVSSNKFDLALGILETSIDPFFLYNSFHSSLVGNSTQYTNYNNYAPIEKMVNETLNYDQIRINKTTGLTHLARTNLEAGSEIVYRNDTVWPSASNYSMDYENGILTVNVSAFDFRNDTLNITYDYRILDHYVEGANRALDLEYRQGFVRDTLGVVARHVPMIPLAYYRVLEAYDRTVYDGWVGMLGGINNFWSYINVKYIPIGGLTVIVDSSTKTLRSNQTANLIIKTTDLDGKTVGGACLQLEELNSLGNLTHEGYTESDGSFSTKYTAPTVSEVTDITIVVKGTLERYYEGVGVFSLTVYPDLDEFVAEMSREKTTIESGEDTGITLTVSSKETGAPVANASVTIEIAPSDFDASVETYHGKTDSTGTFVTRFTASVTSETFFKVTAKVSKDGFSDKQTSTSVKANPIYTTTTASFIGIAEISLIALVIALLVLYFLITFMYKEKKPGAKEGVVEKESEKEPEEVLEAEEAEEEEIDEPDDDWSDEDREFEEEELESEKSDSE